MIAVTTVFLTLAVGSDISGAEVKTVFQSERQIPLVRQTDVLVVGGSLGAVAAAVEAAETGATVLLVAPRNFVGDDLAGTLQLWLEDGASPRGRLVRRLFANAPVTTPLHVKRTLEAALLAARVDFLLASYPTDLLCDDTGQVAGAVIANRAGRQAILAKVVVDATDAATLAQMAGVDVRSPPTGRQVCRRVVLGGQPDSRIEPARTVPAGVKVQKKDISYYGYQQVLDVGDTFAAFAEAEQQMRDDTYRSGQLRASERIQIVPSTRIRDRSRKESVSFEQTTAESRLYVFRNLAAGDVRPSHQEQVGRQIGRSAAQQAAALKLAQRARVKTTSVAAKDNGDILETLAGLRPTGENRHTVVSPATTVPVLAAADIVIVGGGTSGACAAIAAARQGADVIVVEFQEGLGGVGTLGLIGKPYHGLNRGFTAEVPFPDKEHNTEHKMEWFRQQIRQAGGRIWLGVIGCGVYAKGNRVRGAVVATPMGRGVLLADVVIDATGNADIAVAAGAQSMYGGDSTGIALQGTGLPRRPLTNNYVNTDYLLVDESDMVDTWRAFVGTRLAGEFDEYDIAPFIQTRERRRVVGDHVLSYLDQIAERTYPDSVVLSGSDYDSHGYPNEPFFALIPHTEKTLKANHPAPGGTCYTPYRCLLPRGIEGLLVTGLGISMLRDASAMVRMQKDMHNQGYAAGVAAAMAVEEDCTPRLIDVRRLQRHLVQRGNLPETVLTDDDSFPLSDEQIRDAVRSFADEKQSRNARCQALAVILSHADSARSPLKEAYSHSTGGARVTYAKLLGILGESFVVPDLVNALSEVDSWDPKILQGKMAEYAHLPTPTDALILALGYSGDRAALPVILQWLDRLDADVTLSHHRAVALSLEKLADPAAAAPLARLLKKPGMSGHAMTKLEPLYDRDRDRRRRIGPLREIELARALYRCGDHNGLGKRTLQAYTRDIRGLFARHAEAVLDGD